MLKSKLLSEITVTLSHGGLGHSTGERPVVLNKDLASSPFYPRPRYNRRLIIAGFILLVIAAYSLYSSNVSHPYQSTFNVLANKFFKISANLRDQTFIYGQFRETSEHPVSFYIMSSGQFAAFQTAQGIGSLYSLRDVASASVSYTSTIPDTYYLVFTHGSGFLNITETVNFNRTYTSLDDFLLVSGVILTILGGLELYWGLRPKTGRPQLPPPQP